MTKEVIDKINNSGYQGCFILAGGGLSVLGELTKYGGASKMLISACAAYGKKTLEVELETIPKSVSAEMAEELASNAYSSARYYGESLFLFGLGFTSKLTYEGEREGREHEAFLAMRFQGETHLTSFKPVGLTREEQEKQCCNFIILILKNCLTDKGYLI